MSELFPAGVSGATDEFNSGLDAPLRWREDTEPVLAHDFTPTEELLIADLMRTQGITHGAAATAIAYDRLG